MNAALTPKQTQLYLLFPADLILPNRRALFILVQHLNVSIPVPERYQFYNINSNKKEITLHITVQIFSFIFQLSISISRRDPPKGINKVVYFSNPSRFLTEKINNK